MYNKYYITGSDINHFSHILSHTTTFQIYDINILCAMVNVIPAISPLFKKY